MSVTFPIDYYQVNIGVGDCEIILLTKDTPPSTTEIEKAVLIDGGEDAGRITNIKQVITSIKQQYKLKGPLKFDSVVITHWDSDHYTGVLRMMIEDLDAQQKSDPKGTSPLQVSFLKYTGTEPDSTLYIPYKDSPGVSKVNHMGVTRKLVYSKDGIYFGFGGKRLEKVGKVIADMDKMNKDLLREDAHPFVPGTGVPDSKLIGRELFSGEIVDAARSASGPVALLDAYKGGTIYKADKPGLFCVAVNNRYLPPASSSGDDWRRPGDSTLTNCSSISCLVIRPNGSISHYLAGDARSDMEEGVIQWTGLSPAVLKPDGTPPPPPDIKNTVPVIKASHHGAPSSFPLNICQTFKPSVILFSAGNKNLHPDWSNLFYVNAYLASWQGAHALTAGGLYAKPIYLTCYPYYLYDSERSIFPVESNPFELMDDTTEPVQYRDILTGFFSDKDRSLDLVAEFQGEAFTTVDEADLWARKMVVDVILQKYCNITDSAFPSGSTAKKPFPDTIKTRTYETKNLVSSIRIISDDVKWSIEITLQDPKMYPTPSSKVARSLSPSADPALPNKKHKGGGGSGTVGSMLMTLPPFDGDGQASNFFLGAGSGAIGSILAGDGQASKFYIMSTLVEPQDGTHSAYVANEWDSFVSALSAGCITITDNLSSTTTSIELDACDEWLAWLTSALSPSSVNAQVQISVSASLINSKAKIDHFDLVVPLPLPSDQQVSLSFGPSVTVGKDAESSNFDPFKHFLRFGMSANSATITLDNLLLFCDLPNDTVGFGSNLAFQLDEKNSAVWFSPLDENYSAAFRLQANAQPGDWSDTAEALKEIGLWDTAVVPLSVTVIAKREMLKLMSWDGTRCVKTPQLGLSLGFSEFSAVMFCSPQSYTFALQWKNGALVAAKNLLKKVGGSDLVSSFEEVLEQISKLFDVLQVSVEIQRTNSGFKIAMMSVDAQMTLNFGNSGGDKGVAFLLSFVWPRMLFRGALYIPDSTDESWRKLMPYYEELLEVVPTIDPSQLRSSLSILDLIPGNPIKSPPKGIPTEITRAILEVDGSSISFSAALEPSKPPDSAVPPVSFDSLELATFYDWKSESKEFSFSIAVVISLHPSPSADSAAQPTPKSNDDPGFLFASVYYDSGLWTLTGTLTDINFGDLLTFFKVEERSQVKDILGNIAIKSLSLTYEYEEGTPSKFQFDGSIVIAKLELDLLYLRDANGWQVKAALGASEPCTLSDVIASVCGDDAQAFELPDFIGDIKLDISHEGDKPSKWEDSPVYLSCTKPASAGSPLVFALQLTLGPMRVTFLQLSYPTPTDNTAKKTAKRVLMFTFTYVLPSLDLPVIGTLENPVDGLQFLWVQDGNATAGLTRAEVKQINDTVFPTGTGVLFKESKPSPKDADIVVVAGCHFLLLVNDSGQVKAALDYKFAAKKNKPSASTVTSAIAEGATDTSSQEEDSVPGGVSKATVHKVVGPLSLSNIGLQFKDGKLFVVLDATLALGPISFSLLGFGLGAELSADIFTHPDISRFSLELHGLAAALDKPPMLIAGLFEDLSTPTMELFAGGVAVSIKAYSFLAFGSYGVIEDQSKHYKTFFFFAQLRGPLIELEFATINGVTLGFGYNSHLRYPTADDILEFPLVQGISAESASSAASSSNVLSVLSDAVFKTWVNPQDGSLWFAAGLEVLAFETLDVRAVAVIEIDPYVSLGLFADAVCSLPPAEPRNLCFVYVELGISCRVDIKHGLFSVEGKLSPNSFVLHPSCHLLGGFAMYYWFDPSPYAGDFVFSIGGYHPAYSPPSYYPRPQRLSISWQLDSHIGITGESYFAVTPKACMGGGSLSIVFSAGPLGAHLDAHADFLMFWNPFHFIGDIGVSIGVSFSVKIWFVNVHISVDISGSLHLEGPPFGGNVHVNFYMFGFDIYFGSHPGPPPALTLDKFWDLLSRSSNQPGTGKDTGITLVVQSGYAPEHNKDVTPPPQAPWMVVGGQFKFLVQCRFALKTVQFKDHPDADWTDVLSGQIPVYSKPMHSTQPIESTLQVTVTKVETSALVSGFTFKPMLKNVPSAQWGQYVSGDDPINNPRPSILLNGSKSTLNGMLMGAMVAAPLPEYPDDHIPPYNTHDAMYVDIIKGETFPPGNPSPDADSWLPAPTTWDKAEQTWSSPPTDPKITVGSWAKAFKWLDGLAGGPPTLLLKNFKAVYLDIPSLTSA